MSATELSKACPDHKLILFGEFNSPDVIWVNRDHGVEVLGPEDLAANIVGDSFSYLNLYQMIMNLNSNVVFLDLCVTSVNVVSILAVDLLLPNYYITYSCNLSVIDNILTKVWYKLGFHVGVS